MRISTDIENIASRYNVQVGTGKFTALEEEKMMEFGEPLIEVGGTFSGSSARPGQTNTVLTVVGTNTDLALLIPVIVNGIITGVTVNHPGNGYTDSTSVTITGDGQDAVLQPFFAPTDVTIDSVGTNYTVDDMLSVTVGESTLRIKVLGVDGDGGVTSMTVIDAGNFDAIVDDPIALGGGTGSGFTVSAAGNWGISSVAISNGGTGYHVSPVVVDFTLQTATRRMKTDFPVKQVFDLEDDIDSDVMAKVWASTIADRLTAAKDQLIGLSSPFEGETVVTV